MPMMMSIPPNWLNDSMYVILNAYVYHRLLFRCRFHYLCKTHQNTPHMMNQIYSNLHYMKNWTMGMYWMLHYRILHNIFYQMYNNWYYMYMSH